ncbi:MAG: hypothetical protein AB8B58_07190 [Roseobacter sp.]
MKSAIFGGLVGAVGTIVVGAFVFGAFYQNIVELLGSHADEAGHSFNHQSLSSRDIEQLKLDLGLTRIVDELQSVQTQQSVLTVQINQGVDLRSEKAISDLIEVGFVNSVQLDARLSQANYVRYGDRLTLKGVSSKYLTDLDARNKDELDVIMGTQNQPWTIGRAN